MTVVTLLLIFLGPFLMVAVVSAPAVMSWPDLLVTLLRPAGSPSPRPVTRPRPVRWAVA